MERKLSQKALRMRQRFTFSRGRDRASTLPPAGATSTPNSRPRSATTPISSHTITTTTIDATYHRPSTDRTRFYHFTDEPGYFRPASPLLDRQFVSEELEDDVKHACALLVQSVDRGLPIWPSFQVDHRPSTTTTTATAKISSPEAPSRFYYQGASMSPSAVDNQIEIHTDDKMHDSGVGFLHSASAASATTGRFYGTRHSSSRHEESHDEETHRGRSYSRSRGQSFGTDATPASRSRSRSRSLSPDMFPYSPPQIDTLWPHVKDIYSESSDVLFPDTETEKDRDTDSPGHTLGVEGMTWLRASLDIPRLNIITEKTPANININVTAMPAAAPRRFYSTRQQPRAKHGFDRVVSAGWDGSHSRTPSVDDAVSLRSFSSVEDVGIRQGSFYQLRRTVSSHGFEQNQQGEGEGQRQGQDPVYAIVSDAGHRRRRKASHILKKLAGLGKKKDGGAFESRRVAVAV